MAQNATGGGSDDQAAATSSDFRDGEDDKAAAAAAAAATTAAAAAAATAVNDDDDGTPVDPEALLARLTQPHMPENLLLHRYWEPWTRYLMATSPEDSASDEMRQARVALGLLIRDRVAVRYMSWAVPSTEALEVIAQVSGGRVVEVGAGTGYWAWLLALRGVDVVAVDNDSEYCFEEEPAADGEEPAEAADGEDAEVPKGPPIRYLKSMQVCDGPEFLARHGGCPDRALLLCWARHDMGEASLAAYRGDTVVAVVNTGATWELDSRKHPEWRQVRRVRLPQWRGIHDDLRVYRRRVMAGRKEEDGGN